MIIRPKYRRWKSNLKNDDYVLACRHRDADIEDPWSVGFIDKIHQINGEKFYFVGVGWFKYVMNISQEEGKEIIDNYKIISNYEQGRNR